jgi:hypothetical protein
VRQAILEAHTIKCVAYSRLCGNRRNLLLACHVIRHVTKGVATRSHLTGKQCVRRKMRGFSLHGEDEEGGKDGLEV